MPHTGSGHDINVIGAFALGMADALSAAAAQSAQVAGASPAALVALGQVKGGRTINSLAMSLRVSHSRAVRTADALEAAGLARRVPSARDGRVVHLRLTRKGTAAAARIQQARGELLREAVDRLTPAEVAELSRLASKVLTSTTTGREHAHATCRLCDAVACGHYIGTCPVTAAANSRESPAG